MTASRLGIAISESGIGSVLNRYQLRVPINQRPYAWEDSHVKTLLTDFSNAVASENNNYFLGTIVLTSSADGKWEVADGQQRLATTAMLVAAIRDFLFAGSANEKAAANKYSQNFLLEFDELSGEHVPKMKLSAQDNDFFVKTALLDPDNADRNAAVSTTESHEKISRACALCKDHVSRIVSQFAKPDQTKHLYSWINFLREKAIVIEIRVPDQFNAYTLFETLNDRGLRASQADILKNYLFGRAQDRLGEVAPRWAAMTGIIESIDADDLLLTYLRHYWISNNGPTVEKELAERIREKVMGRQQAVDMAVGLAQRSVDYAALFGPLEHKGWESFDRRTRGYLFVMTRILQIEQIRPLLLAVIGHFDSDEAKAAFRMFLSWSVRFLIAGGGGGGVLDRHYGLRAKEIATGEIKSAALISERMRGIVRTDAEFREGFVRARVTKSLLARYYLRAIEIYMSGGDDPDLGGVLEDQQVLNLEHIMPIRPSSEWGTSEEVVQAYGRRIGNMTLLEAQSNVVVGNEIFEVKKSVYNLSPLKITRDLSSFPIWSADAIEERQKKLADVAVKVWTL